MSPLLKQIWTLSGVFLSSFCAGFVARHAASSQELHLNADLNSYSWFTSYAVAANTIGLLASTILMEWIGRKRTFTATILPGLIGWTILMLSAETTPFLIGEILSHVSIGATTALGVIVIGEYASPEHRGLFLVLNLTSSCVGQMLRLLWSPYLGSVAILILLCQLASLAIAITWPESPYWLLHKGKYDRSERIFYLLHGSTDKATEDFVELKMQQQKECTKTPFILKCIKKLTLRSFQKPVIIMFFGTILVEASGRHYVPFYVSQLIEELNGGSLPYPSHMGINLITFISHLFTLILIKLMSRRHLLFITGFLSVIFLFLTSTNVFLVSNGFISNDYARVATFLFVTYWVLVNTGCTIIPLVLLGEIFPLEHKAMGTFISKLIMSEGFLISLSVTPKLLKTAHLCGTFAMFGVLQTISLGVYYVVLPETKDKSLQAIEEHFEEIEYEDTRILESKMDDMALKIYNFNGYSVY